MLVILDRQHGDKGGTWDTGAAFGGHLAAKPDGATYWPNPPIFEVDLTTGYLAHARRHLLGERQHAAARLNRPRFRYAVPRLLMVSADRPSSSSARS